MIADLLDGLFKANLAGGAAILVALLLRRPIRGVFGARAAYLLWAVVPASVLASLLPPIAPTAWPEAIAASMPIVSGSAAGQKIGTDASVLLLAVWLAGCAGALAILCARQFNYVAALGRLTPAQVRGRKVLRAEKRGPGPCVVGSAVVIPPDFEARYSEVEQDAILAHERVHLERGDVAANAAWALGQCAFWFNPLVHLAAHHARLDQEMACDAVVVAGLPASRRPYAEALLKTQLGAAALPVGCTWPSQAAHPLKTRIALLKRPAPGPARHAIGAVILAGLVVSTGFAAWAAQSGAPVIERPDWLRRPTPEDMVRFYPAAAAARKEPGSALLECRVAPSGVLTDCRVAESSTPDFGAAALAMTGAFQLKPRQVNGRPTAGGVVRIPIRFALAP